MANVTPEMIEAVFFIEPKNSLAFLDMITAKTRLGKRNIPNATSASAIKPALSAVKKRYLN